MTPSEIKAIILTTLYEKWWLYSPWGESDRVKAVDMSLLSEQQDIDYGTIGKILDQLDHEGLVYHRMENEYGITQAGIFYAESQGLIDKSVADTNLACRVQFLRFLAEVYEKYGPMRVVYPRDLANRYPIDPIFAMNNLDLLRGAGLIKYTGSVDFIISQDGLKWLEKYDRQLDIKERFQAISGMNPQQRGRSIQALLAEVIEQHGWSQMESVKTSHEEMDIIIFQNREYYLIECKWEKAPVEASVIRELIGKLNNRTDMRGIAASMSGFAKGAVDQVREHVSQRIILLFGPQDIRSMIDGRIAFNELLDEKYKELVTRKKVVFD